MSTGMGFDLGQVRVGRARGRYFREKFSHGGVDLVQIIPELVMNSDAAIAASGRERGRIVLASGDPDPAFLESWRERLRPLRSPALVTCREHRPGFADALRWVSVQAARPKAVPTQTWEPVVAVGGV